MKRKLTTTILASLTPQHRPYYVADELQPGLRVRVSPAGVLTWSLVYRIKGSGGTKSASLGPCDPRGRNGFGLAEARDRAAAIIKGARQGVDVIETESAARTAAKARLTVGDLIAQYARAIRYKHRKGGVLRTADDIERRLKRALSERIDAPADSLDRGELARLLDPVAADRPREAEKRRQSIRAMYRWGKTKGFDFPDPTDGSESYGRGDPRDRSLSADEIRIVWQWLDDGAGAMPPDVISSLRLQLCLGARIGEVAGMSADEVRSEGDRLLWTLPAARSKNKAERVTPLVGTARDIVQAALDLRVRGPLFRANVVDRGLTASDVGHALKRRSMPVARFGSHDLRRTVVSGMDEMGIALDTIAAVIGHRRGSKETRTLVRHYTRAPLVDRIEVALKAWDGRLREIVAGQPVAGNNIVPLRR